MKKPRSAQACLANPGTYDNDLNSIGRLQFRNFYRRGRVKCLFEEKKKLKTSKDRTYSPVSSSIPIDVEVPFKRLASFEPMARRDSRLKIEMLSRTPENVGPGSYSLHLNTIANKQQQTVKKKQLTASRNHYMNFVFSLSPEDAQTASNRQPEDGLHQNALKEPVQSKSIPVMLTAQEENLLKSRLVSFGALYDKIKLRESLQRGKLSKHGEFREAAQPSLQALR